MFRYLVRDRTKKSAGIRAAGLVLLVGAALHGTSSALPVPTSGKALKAAAASLVPAVSVPGTKLGVGPSTMPCSSECGGTTCDGNQSFWMADYFYDFVWKSAAYRVETTVWFDYKPCRGSGSEIYVYEVRLEQVKGPYTVCFTSTSINSGGASWSKGGWVCPGTSYGGATFYPNRTFPAQGTGFYGSWALEASKNYGSYPADLVEMPIAAKTQSDNLKTTCYTNTGQQYSCNQGWVVSGGW